MLTEQEAWQKIYDAFERTARTGQFELLSSLGICGAVSDLQESLEITYWTGAEMLSNLRAALSKCGFDPMDLCWPTTQTGAASRCEFIREHFLPAGTSESTEATGIIKPSNPTQS